MKTFLIIIKFSKLSRKEREDTEKMIYWELCKRLHFIRIMTSELTKNEITEIFYYFWDSNELSNAKQAVR